MLLSQNDIVPLLKRVNHQSKLLGRQITLSEFIQQKKIVSKYKYNIKKF